MRTLSVICIVLTTILACGTIIAEETFPFENASFTSNEYGSECIREVTNNSETSYTVAMFKLSIYDKDGELLDVIDVVINNFATGQAKSFKGISMKPMPEASRVKL